MDRINLGCGHRFHPSWTNVSFTTTDSSVIGHNLSRGIPFPDASFDVVYHSHLLEHFTKAEAPEFLKACLRILRTGGIIRIVVPDLEQIILNYLLTLEEALAGSEDGRDNYNWMLLELFDQMVRNQPGGEMGKYLKQPYISNEDFILKRLGAEAKNLMATRYHAQPSQFPVSWLKRLFNRLYHLLLNPRCLREYCLNFLLSTSDRQALQIGRFRLSGEIHQWMYDRYSLTRLLEECGFEEIKQCTAYDSAIPNWTSFNLDTEPDGSIYKPDSLYIEAVKPK